MSIMELGALGEFVGSILTLATLIYLATQIRQNTSQQKREELVSIQQGQNAVVSQLQDPQLMGGYVRTATDRNPSIQDRGACFSWVVQYLNHFELVQSLYESGALDEEKYELWVGFAVAVIAPEGVRRWWDEEDGRFGFHPHVRDLIDKRLQDKNNPPIPLTEMWSRFFNGDEWAAVAETKNINRGQSHA